MPTRTKAPVGFSSLVESDSEPDFASPEPPRTQMARNATQAKAETKPRVRSPANPSNRVTKPSQRGGRRTSAGVTSRLALQERSNNESRGAKVTAQTAQETKSITDDADDFENEDAVWKQPTRGRPKASNNSAINGVRNGQTRPKSGRGRPPKARAVPVEEIPETQPTEPMEVDEGGEHQANDKPQSAMAPNAESGELSVDNDDDDDDDDVSLRKRLGELTKRYKSLETRYRDLREVGIRDAERNYDRLKKQSEENSAGGFNSS